MNWYKQSQIIEQLEKEAGLKEQVGSSLMAALVMFFLGSGFTNVSKLYNVSVSDIKTALQDDDMTDEAKRLAELVEYLRIQSPQGPIDLTQYTGVDPKVASPDPSNKPQQDAKPKSIIPKTTKSKQEYSQEIQKNILARTLYLEGAGESYAGKMAIASVIYYRAKGDISEIIPVIQKPWQFTPFNEVPSDSPVWTNMATFKGKAWDDCIQIASSVINGTFRPTIKANHYCNLRKAKPDWVYLNKQKTKLRSFEQIGNHSFFYI